MARIRNWGELDYSELNRELMQDYEFDGVFAVVMNIRLDNPIEIPAGARAEARVEDVSYWGINSDSTVDVENGKVRRGDMFSNLIPEEIVRAFAYQRAYKSLFLSLDNSNRNWKEDSPVLLCDLEINIGLRKKVSNPDKFLHSFAGKLNKWLKATRKTASA